MEKILALYPSEENTKEINDQYLSKGWTYKFLPVVYDGKSITTMVHILEKLDK